MGNVTGLMITLSTLHPGPNAIICSQEQPSKKRQLLTAIHHGPSCSSTVAAGWGLRGKCSNTGTEGGGVKRIMSQIAA